MGYIARIDAATAPDKVHKEIVAKVDELLTAKGY
jgi:hypothetical protein